MALLVRKSDYPDTSVSFYDHSGTLLTQHMAHACLLSRAVVLKTMIGDPLRRRRRSSAESREEAFGENKLTQIQNDIRIELEENHASTDVLEALHTFVQCFYVDLSPERIDASVLGKITRNLLCLHIMGTRYGFMDLVSICEDIVTRFMTRELCEGLLEYFIDTASGTIDPNGISIVTTAITWARQCTSGYRWRIQLLTYLDSILPTYLMLTCDPTRRDPARLTIRKCDNCWTIKDSPFPCLITNSTFTSPSRSNVDVTIVWKKRGNGDHALSIQVPRGRPFPPMLCISDFYKSGTWNSRTQILHGDQADIILPSHKSDKLFYAECMCCSNRTPCYIYSLEFVTDETSCSSMDCD